MLTTSMSSKPPERAKTISFFLQDKQNTSQKHRILNTPKTSMAALKRATHPTSNPACRKSRSTS